MNHITILVVDDQEAHCELMRSALVAAGYAVLTATSGDQALERVRSQNIGLVLTDQQMPGMSGVELLRAVQEMIRPFFITGIGSLPHLNPDEACWLVLGTFDIPFWPQLPNVSFREFMIPQYAEGLPCLRINEKKEAIWIERDDNELAGFYENYREGMKLSISDSYAKGLHTFIRLLRGQHFNYLKGQVTGPLTFTLGLKDTYGRLIFFDEEFREVSLLVLKATVRWQIDILKSYADHVILFIDEPVLSALGSSAAGPPSRGTGPPGASRIDPASGRPTGACTRRTTGGRSRGSPESGDGSASGLTNSSTSREGMRPRRGASMT